MPIAITDEQQALQESIRAWAGRFDTSEVRNREPGERNPRPAPGDREGRWKELADIGVLAIALSEECGGAGGSVADLAAALEQAAEALVPGPLLSSVLAGVLLDRSPDAPLAEKLLPRLADGRASAAVATNPGTLRAVETGDGGLTVSGDVDLLPDAGEVSHLLLCARRDRDAREVWFVLDAEHPGVRLTDRPALDFSRSLGGLTLHEAEVAADALVPGLDTTGVGDLAVTLAAAEAAGVAGWCLRTAVEHARTREQFGSPIGSFQAIKHLCAEMLCRVEQAGALAWDAARVCDTAPHEHPLSAAAAGSVVLDAAVETAKDCIQVLGGTGFTWEHDAHLYLRRALALRRLLGGSACWRRRTADLALRGMRRNLRVAGELPAGAEQDRAAVRETVAGIAALPPEQQRARLSACGYLAPHWPEPYGLAAGPALQTIIDEEVQRAGIQRPDLSIGAWAVPTVLEHGTREQQERFVWPTLHGEITWCQLFSEPGAGSDLASLRTRAEREPGGWRLSGQKVWTSLARQADWAICLARTDPEAPKHRGITYFLVDMTDPGIETRPLREITGEAVFNEVFLDGVFVPDGNVVGDPGQGWRLARTTLANERVAMAGGSSLGAEVERLLGLAHHEDRATESYEYERIGTQVAEGLSVSLLGLRATVRRLNGREPGAESSVEKLVGVRHRQDAAEAALELLGPDGAAVDGAAAGPAHEFLLSRCLSIAGGSTQILLTVAAERILGLPRA
ncbi:hypothetical protein DFQ14_104163 [Halopolyspora algeriensis]|uniref:Alkylation response protein AidB-like acyl-CoA dehydrogenase n=1 Tax=Halopolyspora algeriensis TaxID=1500506 RepID=A0A368VYB9_9ACTN|nr:acyl-CoA dehydrogenase [Halopolyspora algeriensis]RCW44574.1 hypothetical protein DFQ14_104163 [Halopolyspora algeriensis]TQM55934.1 hypothetical protein FHU43_0712 [Halopolyspora algeriensis]